VATKELCSIDGLFRNKPYPLNGAYEALEGVKATLEKEFGSTYYTNVIERWTETSRGYEDVKCLVGRARRKVVLGEACEAARELSLVLTVRKTPKRCPECSIKEAKRLLPTSLRKNTLKHLRRLEELREEMEVKFDDLKADLDRVPRG
jgi:hypothetical protein